VTQPSPRRQEAIDAAMMEAEFCSPGPSPGTTYLGRTGLSWEEIWLDGLVVAVDRTERIVFKIADEDS